LLVIGADLVVRPPAPGRAGWLSFSAAAVGATMSAAGRRLKLIIACRPRTLEAAWRAAAGTGC